MSVFDLPGRHPTKSPYYVKNSYDPNDIYDLYLDESTTKPLIILPHGGYWRPEYSRDHLSQLAGALNDNGSTVLLPDYSRMPGNPNKMLNYIESFFHHVQAHNSKKSKNQGNRTFCRRSSCYNGFYICP